MKKYFVRLGSKQYGPATIEELKKMNISRDTLIWYKGLSKWMPADQLPEIKAALFGATASSPSFGQSSRPQQKRRTQTSIQDIVNDFSSEEKKEKGKRVMWVVVLAIAFGAFFAYDKYKNMPADSNPPVTPGVIDTPGSSIEEKREQMERRTPKSSEAASPINYLSIKTKLDNTATNITGTITNTASVTTYKDVSFTVFYENANGTSLELEEFTVNDRIPPGETVKFKFKANAPAGSKSTDVTFNEAKVD